MVQLLYHGHNLFVKSSVTLLMSGKAKFEPDLILSTMISPALTSVKKLIAFIDYIRELTCEEQKAFFLWKSEYTFNAVSHTDVSCEISLINQTLITLDRSIVIQTLDWLKNNHCKCN